MFLRSLMAILTILYIFPTKHFTHNHEDSWVQVEDDLESSQPEENSPPKNIHNENVYIQKDPKLTRLKRNIDGFLKPYIDKLKNVKYLIYKDKKQLLECSLYTNKDEELVVSNEAGFSGSERFKSGDIHIKKSSGLKGGLDINESQKASYRYTLGLGLFLMSGCYDYLSHSPKSQDDQNIFNQANDDSSSSSSNEEKSSSDDSEEDKETRRKRSAQKFPNQTDFRSFCRKFAQLQKNRECNKMIPGVYTLGSGFDIKFENSENSRRKSIINRHCNYQKFFNKHSVPDIITANGIFDTKTQTMTFGESSDYVKFVAAKANLDRYSNVFSSDTKDAYGGIIGQKNLAPGTSRTSDGSDKGQRLDQKVRKSTENSDYWLSQIQSTILIYDLLLDQISPWNIDLDVLIDFLNLPESYFHENAPKKFEKFISRYGTHVVVSAKFGGEFKILHTMRKSKSTRMETFAQQSIEDAMSMFSRSWNMATGLGIINTKSREEINSTRSNKFESKSDREEAKNAKSEYSSTYLSIKGGSQEVAAIVANLNQPDFSDSFISWLRTVPIYPRAFDLKFESLASIFDFNVASLLGEMRSKDAIICPKCKLALSLQEFEDKWRRRLSALKFAITVYLKEPSGLSGSNRFSIDKGDSDCRFNIVNYLAPKWSELTSGEQEFQLSFYTDYEDLNLSEIGFFDDDNNEVLFTKRDDFWLVRHKNGLYGYQSARLLPEPFRSSITMNYLNLNGLVLAYNEKDATVSIGNFEQALSEYSNFTRCDFQLIESDKNKNTTRLMSKRSSPSTPECRQKLRWLKTSAKRVRNLSPKLHKYWSRVIGVVDYVDPMKAAERTSNLNFAVMPCQLKWSNNLMIFLDKKRNGGGKCLKFTAATQGELYVVIATTPSDQKSWYIFQISTRGVIFYKSGKMMRLKEDSAAGTTGNADIYQNFLICLSYDKSNELTSLNLEYGIEFDSKKHRFLNYRDTDPLEPSYYSFGSRTARVEVLNARIENQNDYLPTECSNWINTNECLTHCPIGYERSEFECKDVDECFRSTHKCSLNSDCENTSGSYKCKCKQGYSGDGHFCEDIDECSLNIHNCSEQAKCVNLKGFFRCDCLLGFTGDGINCSDINECELNYNDCDWNKSCVNTIGSFRCV